jgi:hypothetical protein
MLAPKTTLARVPAHEVGGGPTRAVDLLDRLGAGGEGPAEVGVRVAQAARHGLEDGVGHLRAARAVEEGGGAPAHATHERREAGAHGGDVERRLPVHGTVELDPAARRRPKSTL